ncbi:hypothetical protein PA598K_04184 [Paenibacillus sp. 598K]|nr:hypothetical protein PA598K_04184 [Paenibacillus sp. 598K]
MTTMKIAVIGCTHAGTAAVTQLAKQHPEAEITVYERNDNISFLSCGIALHVGGVVKEAEQLFYATPQQLKGMGVKMRMRHEVLGVDTAAKTLTARSLDGDHIVTDSYDKLVMTTGSWPIIPKMDGMDLDNILLCKNYGHAKTIMAKATDAQRVTIVGAGYIGIELVEAFEQMGKQVTLIDNMDRILCKYLDEPFTAPLEAELKRRGVELALGRSVEAFEGDQGPVKRVITTKGAIDTDLVVLCIGFRPNTELLRGQVETLPNGAILVDEYMRTSNPDIFAAGDSCAVHYNPAGTQAYIPLATNAVRMGTLIARNLMQPTVRYMGTQGTSGLKLYDYNLASTGMTEQAAVAAGMDVQQLTLQDHDIPEFMPHYEQVLIRLVYEAETGRIVGGQILSKADLTQQINTLSVCIQNGMTVAELAFVDFFFQPHYNKPWNLLNQTGLQAMAAMDRGGVKA